MKIFKPIFMLMALCAGICVSCDKEDDVNNGDIAPEGEAVHFAVSTAATRTVYGSQEADNSWPVYWTAGDDIRIYSPEACGETSHGHKQTATYEIEPGGGSTPKGASLKNPSNDIYWSSKTTTHNFYATYPAVGANDIDANGVATFPINFNQTCTIKAAASNNQFTAEPDMKANAYMVAKTSASYTGGNVSLEFKPIMTTLDIVVNGPTSGNPVTLTGVTVNFKLSNKVSSTSFKYDIKNGTMVDGGAEDEVTIFVGVLDKTKQDDNGNDQAFIDLAAGQSIKLTVMLPPNAIGNTKTAKIRIHAQANDNTGAINKSVTIGKDAGIDVAASAKRQVNLPNITPTTGASNAWITPLDDNIYVSQLSIPGTHDAATSKLDETILKVGRSQVLTIQQQLEMGIRAFDLRPTIAYSSRKWNVDNIYHGFVDCKVSFESVLKTIADYLSANPKEFAIVVMRFEDDRVYVYPQPKESDYISAMQSFLTSYTAYTDRMVAYKPDLTVGDMRGKILIISRNNLSPAAAYQTAYTGWNHSNPGYHTVTGTAGSGTVYVQDIYDKDQAGVDTDAKYITAKRAAIKTAMVESASFYTTDAKKNNWMLNHCSGYTGLNNYCDNAAQVNQDIFNYVTGTAKPVGPLGLVMLDFVGKRKCSYALQSYTVYGDLLPQTIIDNNYKFPMKKK